MSFGTKTRIARIAREIKDIESKPPWGISCYPETPGNNDVLVANLLGPKESPYERGHFVLVITIPQTYPFEPPLLKFKTPIYHPNIDKAGRICMDTLKMPPTGSWLPTITLETLLVSLQILLAQPNPDDPLMIDIAHEYKFDYPTYVNKAKEITEQYAL